MLLVLVGGAAYYFGTQKGKIPFNTTSTPGSAKPEQTPDVTSNWKTQTYGSITLKYPSEWQIEGGGVNEKLFVGPVINGYPTYHVEFNLGTNPANLTSKEYVAKFLDSMKGGPGFHFGSQEDIMIGGKPAVVLHSVFAFDQSSEEIFVVDGDKLLTIDFPSKSENANLLDPVKNYDVVQQILSTIKFTN